MGLLVAALGWFAAVREMFHENRGFGYAGFLMPIVALVYSLLHWDDLKRQAILMLIGATLLGGGIALQPRH